MANRQQKLNQIRIIYCFIISYNNNRRQIFDLTFLITIFGKSKIWLFTKSKQNPALRIAKPLALI